MGAPSFFPTVWGWVKRWFDPVTVSKIFILGKHEVKSTISAYVSPDDFPQRYGGNLDWDFGMVPHMDEESSRAVERDGRKGWVDGPCLWLDRKRFAVGTVDGKLRRPGSEIAALKPVVYAADHTADQVHPNAAAKHKSESSVPTAQGSAADSKGATEPSPAANGDFKVPSPPILSSESVQQGAETDVQADQADPEIRHASEASDPVGSHHHVDEGATMETLANKPEHEVANAPPVKQAAQAENTETPPTAERAVRSDAEQMPADHGVEQETTDSKQVNVHESLIHDMTTKKLQDESVSRVPSNTNGSAHHDELLVASDPAKGLVLETEKLYIDGQVKPPMERFTTAVEEITTINGRA